MDEFQLADAQSRANIATVETPERRTQDLNIPDPEGRRSTDGPIERSGPSKQITIKPLGADTPGKVTGVGANKPKVGKVTAAGGDAAKASYDAARKALRSGDAGKMTAAVGKLPKGTKKTATWTKNLEAGIQAAGNRPPPATPAPKADAPAQAPAKTPKVGRLEGAAPAEAPDPKLKKELAAERGKNTRLKKAQPATVEAPAEPMRGVTEADTRGAAGNLRGIDVGSVDPTAEQVAAAKKQTNERSYQKKRRQGFRARQDAQIAEKGIMTASTETTEVTPEEARAKVKKMEAALLDATLAEDRGRKTTAPKAVGAGTDKRTAAEIVGEEAVEARVHRVAPGPVDLETEHGGGRQQGTIADIINEDTKARDSRNEQIREAAGKARTVAASRDATPEQDARLEKAIASEYDKGLELYFDDPVDERPKNQRGPRKPDARTMFLDPMIEADAELAQDRGSAQPPAPSDRTTVDQKIAEVQKRIAAGGESIYKGRDTLKMLENLRDQKPAEVTPPKSTRVLPPPKALVTEHYSPIRPSVKRAKVAGTVAGETAAKQKKVSGKAGPVKVPDMTKPGVIPAGPTTPPVTPAVEHARVEAPIKSHAERWSNRIADWGRSAYAASIKKLTSPAIDVAGEKAKATFSTEARIKAAKGLGVATIGFTALGAAEAGAAEHDPKKRLGAAGKRFKADLPEVGKSIALFTGADLLATKAIPAVAGKVATAVGASATKAAFARGLTAAVGRLGLAGVIGYHAIPYAVDQSKKLASAIGEAGFDKSEAAREKKASEAKYGTVEKATKTRHAKEAYKRALAKKGKK